MSELLSGVRGIRRAIVDVSDNDHWKSKRLLPHERDQAMAQGIGTIAIDLANSSTAANHPSKLGFVAGKGYRGVERLFKAQGAPFSGQYARRPALQAAREMARAYVGKSVHANEHRVRGMAKDWFRNLRAQGYKPKDDKLGSVRSRW
jgi:hypothetical protein